MSTIIHPRPPSVRAPTGGGARRRPPDDRRTASLVRRAAGGEQHAWDQLVDAYGGLVWATARSHGLSEADAADVCQSTWCKLVGKLGALRRPEAVGAWLATTARRQCVELHRAQRGVVPLGDDLPEQLSHEPAPDRALLLDQRDRGLTAALDRIPARDAQLLRVLFADPAPRYADVAATLGVPVGSIGPMRERALTRLRREAVRLRLGEHDG